MQNQPVSEHTRPKRRSLSLSTVNYSTLVDVEKSVLNSKPKSHFLSRFKTSLTVSPPPIMPIKSSSTSTLNMIPPIDAQQKVKRKPLLTSGQQDMLDEKKKSPQVNNRGFGNIFRRNKGYKKNTDTLDSPLPSPTFSDSIYNGSKITIHSKINTESGTNPSSDKPIAYIAPIKSNSTTTYTHKPSSDLSPDLYSSPSKNDNDINQAIITEVDTMIMNIPETSDIHNPLITEVDNILMRSSPLITEMNDIDLVKIVSNNVQKRTPARLIITTENEDESDADGNSPNESEEDTMNEDVFEPSDMSTLPLENKKNENKLSKRLSGGHYGSAGGLMMSIMAPSADSSDINIQQHRNRQPPEDVVLSMINWKRQSGTSFKKSVSDHKSNNGTSVTPPQVPKKDEVHPNTFIQPDRPLPPFPSDSGEYQQEATEAALKLWEEDELFVKRELIAEWLGKSKSLNKRTLVAYMEHFDFSRMKLDNAFRKVCSKLYFRAEAQQIDRILEAFAKRYWQCNPKSVFGSSDVVYAVVYSLLLLNTDLHVAQGNYTRMSRQAFVKNTMTTIKEQYFHQNENAKMDDKYLAWEAHLESHLKDMYVSVKHNQILQPVSQRNYYQNDQMNPHTYNNNYLNIYDSNISLSSHNSNDSSSRRVSMIGGKRMIDIKRSLNTMIHKSSARESVLILEEVAPFKSQSSISTKSATNPRSVRRSSVASSLSESSSSNLSRSPTNVSTNRPIPQENTVHNQLPYMKEGVVMRKYLLESANHKAKHREWRECLLVVKNGELKMFGLPPDYNNDVSRRSILRVNASALNINESRINNLHNPHEPLSSVYTQFIGTVKLNHTLANILPPPGYNRHRPYVMAIQEHNGGVCLIQATSHEEVMEWIAACNYWAARLSKEPFPGGVSNIEYGWGSCLDDVILDLDAVESGKKIMGKYVNDPDAVSISQWVPPTPTMHSSSVDEETHYNNLRKYMSQLNDDMNENREIKKKILVKFPPKCQNHARVLSNWECKSKYMLHEIIKYQNYLDALENSINKQKEESL